MKQKIIASLTSYPARISTIRKVIESIANQTVRADKIILYLAQEQFLKEELPEILTDLLRKHPEFEIRRWNQDIRSFKKLVPALTEFPDDIIITFDDDIIYSKNVIKKLMKSYKKYPNAISGCRVKLIKIKDGNIEKYKKWSRYRTLRLLISGSGPKFTNIATTGGGALFPPHSLHPDVIRDDVFMNLCPTTDDLWFWAMAVLNGTKTVPAGKYISIQVIEESQTEALSHDNLWGKNLNDKNMKKILEIYPEIKNRIFKHI